MNYFQHYKRKQRGITQKIFLIETIEKKNNTSREYVVMGSTGNVYNVNITNNPTCTCPDYSIRYNRCKHIYFILLRVMKVNNPDKEKYTDSELINMFKNIPEITNILCVNENIKNQYLKNKNNKIQIKDDDICPICLEDIQNGEIFEYCRAKCGKCVHKTCFDMWCKKNPVKCLICRSPWGSKYINLETNT